MPTITPLAPGDPARIGAYRLAGRLNDAERASARGTQFFARTLSGEQVTVTLLSRRWAPDAAGRDRFAAEAINAGRVAPFCAVRMLDAGFAGNRPYLAYEHAPGPTMRQVVDGSGPRGAAVLNRLAIGSATGLAAIHQAGVVHGAFGPDNVVLGRDGPRVTNFGITPPYGAATPAADVLAWAATMVFAATGSLPVNRRSRVPLPEPLRGLVTECLSENPGDRPPSRMIVARLLGYPAPPPGMLAEGSRAAVAPGDSVDDREPPPASSGHRRRSVSPNTTRVGIAVAVAAGVAVTVSALLPRVFAANSGHLDIVPAHSAGAGQPAAPSAARPPPVTSAPQTTAPATPQSTLRVPQAFAGTWQGQVTQAAPSLTFTVRIDLPANGGTGSITYPPFGCSGDLVLTEAGSNRLMLAQHITRGFRNCSGGLVTLTPRPDGTVTFAFRSITAGPTVTGTLRQP